MDEENGIGKMTVVLDCHDYRQQLRFIVGC